MRFANLSGRAVIVVDDGRVADLAKASDGSFGPSPADCYRSWAEVVSWVAANGPALDDMAVPLRPGELGPPSPTPHQVFAIGLNYAAHAAESGLANPEHPTTFTKFPTCLAGPQATVDLPSDSVDWEVELVVVIGVEAHRVDEADAWAVVAGLTAGQDLSDRKVQMRPPVPQFSLGKSFPGFGPTGPWLVTPDELDNPDDIALSCSVDGEVVQSSRTSDLIFSVPHLIDELSHITPLLPGDLIFTGTPSGVGMARQPPRFLTADSVLETSIDGIGTMTTTFRKG
jgi:2-keto-4-pentenoate hydratase/2-oxohepta-3-ene-1,7-dioic acid hydratase in catechol pathway